MRAVLLNPGRGRVCPGGRIRMGAQLLGLRDIGNGKRSPWGSELAGLRRRITARRLRHAVASPEFDGGQPTHSHRGQDQNKQREISPREHFFKGAPRFLTRVRLRRLSRTPRATLPPFLVSVAPIPGYSALPHRKASGEPPQEIPILRRRFRPPATAPIRDCYGPPRNPDRDAPVHEKR